MAKVIDYGFSHHYGPFVLWNNGIAHVEFDDGASLDVLIRDDGFSERAVEVIAELTIGEITSRATLTQYLSQLYPGENMTKDHFAAYLDEAKDFAVNKSRGLRGLIWRINNPYFHNAVVNEAPRISEYLNKSD